MWTSGIRSGSSWKWDDIFLMPSDLSWVTEGESSEAASSFIFLKYDEGFKIRNDNSNRDNTIPLCKISDCK